MSRALLLLLLLAGCSSTNQTPIHVVEPTKQVQIDQTLLLPCAKPAPMTSMNQGQLLEHSIKEAQKLILCGQSQATLANLLCIAINCQLDLPKVTKTDQ